MAMDSLGELDPLTVEIFQSARRVGTMHRQMMMKSLAAEGGHPGEAFCLVLLAQHDGMSQRDLAESLHLSRPWITKLLQSLEKSGVVVRRDDEQDQRLTRVYLTEKGRAREQALRTAWSGYLDQTVGSLPENDRRELLRLIGLIADNIEALVSDNEGEDA